MSELDVFSSVHAEEQDYDDILLILLSHNQGRFTQDFHQQACQA